MKKSKLQNKKVVFPAAFVILALLIVGSVLVFRHVSDTDTASKKQAGSDPSKVDTSPATDAEKSDSEKATDRIIEQQKESQNNQNNGPKTVTPVITYANVANQQVEINAYVNGIVEDGGICTITATKGSLTITATTPGSADATTTTCDPATIAQSKFSQSGAWDVAVSYSSAAAQGTSQSKTVTIP